MRPLHLLDTSLPLVAGYTTRTRGLLEAQRAQGLAPVALTGLRQGPSLSSVETLHGLPYFRTPHLHARGLFEALPLGRELSEVAALAWRAVEVGREVRADLIHAHSPVLCGWAGWLAARWLGVPFVYEVRALWEDAAAQAGKLRPGSPRYLATRALETLLARRADALVVLCEGLRGEFLQRGVPASGIRVVGNGVDPARFRQDGGEGQENPPGASAVSSRTVAYVGSLFRFEGVDALLRALAVLLREDPQLQGLIAGGGECAMDLRKLHSELGLGERVRLLGPLPPEEVNRVYAQADVLVYPRQPHRITELTTPLKPLEALALGKVVVASDVGGHRELLRHGATALLYAAGSQRGLLEALRRALSEPETCRRLAHRGRCEVLEHRTWLRTCAPYPELYGRLLGRRLHDDESASAPAPGPSAPTPANEPPGLGPL